MDGQLDSNKDAPSRPRPMAFVVSPPAVSAAARVRQRHQKENRTPAMRTLRRSPTKVKKPLKFEFNHDPVNYDGSLSIIESLKSLGLTYSDVDECDFPDVADHPVRKVTSMLIKRISHLNQLVQECMHENTSLKAALISHKDTEMSLNVEIEHLQQTLHILKERLGDSEKEQKLAEKKAKLNYAALEKRYNAIRFKDKQYNNEIRKRELECEKIQKKLRSVMASSKPGSENPSMKSSFQILPTAKLESKNMQQECILLKETNQRLDKRLQAESHENARMRELFHSVISRMRSNNSDDISERCTLDETILNLPIELSGEHLQAIVERLIAKLDNPLKQDLPEEATSNDHLVDDPASTIKDLKQIIRQQEELIRRAIFKEPEISPRCRRCDPTEKISPVKL